MVIERTLPMLSVMLPDTVKLVNVPTEVIAGCAGAVTVTALVINVLVLTLSVPSPRAINPVPNLIPPNTEFVAVETGPVGPCGPLRPVLP